MLSKEEIENKLEQVEDDQITISLLYQKIDLLEAHNYEQNNIINSYIEREQKLIEKLEEDKNKFAKENRDGSLQDYVEEILRIVKGGNDE